MLTDRFDGIPLVRTMISTFGFYLFVDDITLENNGLMVTGNLYHESDPEVDLIPPDTEAAIIQPDPTIGNHLRVICWIR